MGPPTIADGGSRDPLEGWARADTVLTDTQSIDHATVDVTDFDRDFFQVLQPAQHTQITGVVDDRLNPKRPAAFEVTLDPRVAEVGVEGHLVAGAQQPGAVTTLGCGGCPAAEMICISSGRPISRLSAHNASKNPRACRGVSKTMVRETSTWRMVMSHQYPRPVGLGQWQRLYDSLLGGGPSEVRCGTRSRREVSKATPNRNTNTACE